MTRLARLRCRVAEVSRSIGGLLLAASPAVFALARYAILDTVFAAFVFGGATCLAIAAL